MEFIRNLNLRSKLIVMLLFPLCTIFWYGSEKISTNIASQNSLYKEKELTTVSIDVGNIIESLQKERGISYLFLSDDTGEFQDELSEEYVKSDKTIKNTGDVIFPILANLNSDKFSQEVKVVFTKLAPVAEYRDLVSEKKISPEAALDFYNAIIDDFLDLMNFLRSDNQSLEISNELESYILLSKYSNLRGLERAYVGMSLLSTDNSESLVPKITTIYSMGENLKKDFLSFASPETRNLFEEGIDKKIGSQIDQVVKSITENQGIEGVGADKWFVLASSGIDTIDSIKDQVATNIIERVTYLSNQASYLLYMTIIASLGVISLTVIFSYLILQSILKPVKRLSEATQRVLNGELNVRVNEVAKDEIGNLSASFNEMVVGLEVKTDEIEQQSWIKDNVAQISTFAQSCENLEELAQKVISHLAESIQAGSGAFYITEQNTEESEDEEVEECFCLAGTYAYTERNHMRNRVRYGESLVGQCATEKQMIVLNDVPSDYIQIESGLGKSSPLNVTVVPILIENQVLGIIELASFHQLTEEKKLMLSEVAKILALIINNIMDKKRTKDLLAEAQALSEETRIQSDELRAANEQLEEKTRDLERQKDEVENKNREIEMARERLQQKTQDLEEASQYKSDFLANMSHELRTPLNSLLLLSQMLLSNEDENLNDDQLESIRIINNSGQDLLQLINDILDLSKVEAGKLSIEHENIEVTEIVTHIKEQFDPVSKEKNLPFNIEIEPNVTKTVKTDIKRVEQILRNLISNSFKFTHKGSITLRLYKPGKEVMYASSGLRGSDVVGFEVKDTGIGVPKEKLEEIFGAFQQLDGSITRKYGGTGLGLTISRKLSQLLGGEIQCESEVGKGSVFTFFLPLEKSELVEEIQGEMDVVKPKKLETIIERAIEDTRQDFVSEKENSLLIIEDDAAFAHIIQNIATSKGYKTTIANTAAKGLELAESQQPDGIILDLGLSDMDGLAVLDKLKENKETMEIPVHIISGRDPQDVPGNQSIGFLSKPITDHSLGRVFGRFEKEWKSGETRNVLIVENDQSCSTLISKALKDFKVKTTQVENCEKARELLKNKKFDCIILDLGLPDIDGATFLNEIKTTLKEVPPVIVYTGRELTKENYQQLRLFADSVLLKDGKSLEHLQNEILMFLQEVDEKDSEEQLDEDIVTRIKGSKILIVDDDIRNSISLIKVFKSKGVEVVTAENGLDGINKLESDPDIELVIMDIMMPVMNGFEAIEKIRSKEKYQKLPVIALTAKAMPEDGRQCIEVGANEYLTKPVNLEKLLSIINVWLPSKRQAPTP